MTINKEVFIAVIPLLLSLSACQDEEFTTTVSGKVINFGSREPIEGAYVYLKDGVASSSPFDVGSNASDQRSEGYTDVDGEFSLELTGEYSAYLGVSKEDYWEFEADGAGIKSYGYNSGNFENQVIELKAYAGFNPLFKSTVPVTPTDSLVIITIAINPELPADEVKDLTYVGGNRLYVGQQILRFVPGATTKEFSRLTVGDTYTPYQIAYTRNGRWQTKIDSVYIKSFETYTDTIYY